MAGLIDWHLIQEMSFRNGGQDSSVKGNEMWSNAAPMYHFMSGLEQKYTLRQVDEMTLDQNDTVLDIGCGIGRLSVPVAQRVRAVTSIDIADGMLEYCRRNASVAELTNVTVQKLDWKKAQIGIDIQTHDVAFASRSVGMRDIVKLNKVARKYAFLLSFAGYPSLRHVYIELLDGLREKKHNGAAHLGPRWRTFGYNVAFNILYDMGIDPTVKVITDGFERIYGSREEAYDDLRFVAREIHPDGRLTDEQESIFRKNVDLYLSKEPNDTWRFLRNTKTYIIGWETKELD